MPSGTRPYCVKSTLSPGVRFAARPSSAAPSEGSLRLMPEAGIHYPPGLGFHVNAVLEDALDRCPVPAPCRIPLVELRGEVPDRHTIAGEHEDPLY